VTARRVNRRNSQAISCERRNVSRAPRQILTVYSPSGESIRALRWSVFPGGGISGYSQDLAKGTEVCGPAAAPKGLVCAVEIPCGRNSGPRLGTINVMLHPSESTNGTFCRRAEEDEWG